MNVYRRSHALCTAFMVFIVFAVIEEATAVTVASSVAGMVVVKVTVELPASLHRDLVAYAEVLARETGQPTADPVRLIVPMLERFIATDRGFAKARKIRS